jgi:hypothetical protein
MRLRALAAVLGCLAVLASGFMAVAAATVPSGQPAAGRSVMDAPCSDCEECGAAACPAPAATCAQACFGTGPATTGSAFRPLNSSLRDVSWPRRTIFLAGLSPPPDPFPPRA